MAWELLSRVRERAGMAHLLAIGTDRAWLSELVRVAEASGHRVTVCPSVFAAWALGDALAALTAVIVDAEDWDQRASPALRALRSRTSARTVAVHGATATPRLHADVLVSKAAGCRAALERCACARSRHAVAGSFS